MTTTALNPKTAASVGAGGTVVVPVACDNVNGNSVVLDGTVRLRFNSTPGGTITFPYPVLVDGQTVPTKTVTVAAAGVVYVNPGAIAGGAAALAAIYPGNVLNFTASASTMFVEVVN